MTTELPKESVFNWQHCQTGEKLETFIDDTFHTLHVSMNSGEHNPITPAEFMALLIKCHRITDHTTDDLAEFSWQDAGLDSALRIVLRELQFAERTHKALAENDGLEWDSYLCQVEGGSH